MGAEQSAEATELGGEGGDETAGMARGRKGREDVAKL